MARPEEITKTLEEITARIRSREPRSSERDVEKQPVMDEEAQRLVAAYRIVEPRFALEKADHRLLNTLLAWVWRDERYNHLHRPSRHYPPR